MDGLPTGLDYASVVAWLRARGYGRGPKLNLQQTLDDIEVMERASLNAWAEARAAQQQTTG